MRQRFPITERYVTTMENLHYVSPDEIISIHLLFDMLSSLRSRSRSTVTESKEMPEHQRHAWEAITHGFLVMGVEDVERIHAVQAASTTQQKMKVLFEGADRESHRLLNNLWKTRCAYMALPLSWSGLIAGHPIIGTIPYTENMSGLTPIADDALRTAKENKLKAHEIDRFIVQLWGQTTPLNDITVNELAKVTRSVIELNGLYAAEHFDL